MAPSLQWEGHQLPDTCQITLRTKMTQKKSIFQRPLWVTVFALTAAIAWGWAYPLIKLGFAEFMITADMTAGKMLFAGIRFGLSGLIILAIARLTRRDYT